MIVQDKREAKVEHLLEKGTELLWSKGYTATSVNDIVKSAGVPKGSFYFYFDSKDDFILKSLDRYFKMMIKPALEILHNDVMSPRSRLIEFYEFRITTLKEELHCQKGCMACNLSSEISERNEPIRDKVNSFHAKMRNEIVKVVEEGQRVGEIGNKVKAINLVAFIEDASKGSMISMKEMKSAYPVDNVLNIVKELLL
ncbi:MAG: TetR/AcrR family transcriptional repressor of nem operon [Saprospiraceae bacterium]|jgi:TetR/AcrR family transcriptional repressor of nem operon